MIAFFFPPGRCQVSRRFRESSWHRRPGKQVPAVPFLPVGAAQCGHCSAAMAVAVGRVLLRFYFLRDREASMLLEFVRFKLLAPCGTAPHSSGCFTYKA